jgi:nucleotide-binding universal stress UspA family protein
MSDTIVVGVDGSDTAAKAAVAAAKLAGATGAQLHIVTAYKESASGVVEVGSDEFYYSSDDEALAVARAEAVRVGVAGVTVKAVHDKPGDALISEAKRLGASMIVVGNRRMQGIGRLLGSVASDVAHHAPCDVYIVKTT